MNQSNPKPCQLRGTAKKLEPPYQCILIDINGTLVWNNKPLPGTTKAVTMLRRSKLRLRFVTNTAKESCQSIHNRLVKMGFKLSLEEIYSSISSIKEIIKSHSLKPMLLLPDEIIENMRAVSYGESDNPDAVIIGNEPSLIQYDKLNEAFHCLIKGATLFGLFSNKYSVTDKELTLGSGCYLTGLEYSAGCKAELLGKPNNRFFLNALGTIDPKKAIMIGDNAEEDIVGALNSGMHAYLVRTGIYTQDDEFKIALSPTKIFNNFVEAATSIFNEMMKN